MKTTVIFHSADFDGIFCREIAKKFLGTENVDYIGWNFGDPKIPMPPDGIVYIMDLSPECLDWPFATGLGKERMIWIDHHKTSIEKFPQDIPGYRIDGVAACRLGWQWFNWPKNALHPPAIRDVGLSLPEKRHFVDREVSEPLAVRLAGEYDVAGPSANDDAINFQYGLRSTEIAGDEEQLLTIGEFGDKLVREISERGEIVLAYLARQADRLLEAAFTLNWHGVTWLAANGSVNNRQFQAAATSKHQGLLSFRWCNGNWIISMYGLPGNTLDFSVIAKEYGGGGHPSACGMTLKELPFKLA